MYVRITDSADRGPYWRPEQVETLLRTTAGTRLEAIRDPLRGIISRMLVADYIGTLGIYDVWLHNGCFYSARSGMAGPYDPRIDQKHSVDLICEPDVWCQDRETIAAALNRRWYTGRFRGRLVLMTLD